MSPALSCLGNIYKSTARIGEICCLSSAAVPYLFDASEKSRNLHSTEDMLKIQSGMFHESSIAGFN